MPIQKIEFEYDIPEGYRFAWYGCPKKGESYLEKNKVRIAEYDYDNEWPIVEKMVYCNGPTKTSKRHKHADLIHAWAEGAIIQLKLYADLWEDCANNSPAWNVGNDYRIKPAVKKIKFRNYLTTSGELATWVIKEVPIEVTENRSDFAHWIGDWQSIEVEEYLEFLRKLQEQAIQQAAKNR